MGSLFMGGVSVQGGCLYPGEDVSVQGSGSLSRGRGLCLGGGGSLFWGGLSVQWDSISV